MIRKQERALFKVDSDEALKHEGAQADKETKIFEYIPFIEFQDHGYFSNSYVHRPNAKYSVLSLNIARNKYFVQLWITYGGKARNCTDVQSLNLTANQHSGGYYDVEKNINIFSIASYCFSKLHCTDHQQLNS